MFECVSLEEWVKCEEGKILEKRKNSIGDVREKSRGMRVIKGKREGKHLRGERGSWSTMTEATFIVQPKVFQV